eukprot:6179243-Pleurochrysis_carterae.AAC.2
MHVAAWFRKCKSVTVTYGRWTRWKEPHQLFTGKVSIPVRSTQNILTWHALLRARLMRCESTLGPCINSDEQKSSKESLFKAAQEEKEKLQKIHEYKSALLSAKHSDSTIPDVMARARLKKYNFDVVATLQDLDIDVVAHAPVALFHAWKRERQARRPTQCKKHASQRLNCK